MRKTASRRVQVWLVRLLLAPLPIVALGLFMTAVPMAAQGNSDDLYFDWPVGLCVEGKRVFGHEYKIQQEFDNLRSNWSAGRCVSTYDCWHAGLDIHRQDDGSKSVNDPVFAVADGRVAGTADWGTEGKVVIVEHNVDGDTVFSQYGHLNQVFVVENEPVRRGQPVGNILPWPASEGGAGNSHVHVEMRDSLKVGYCPKTSPDNCTSRDYSLDSERSCAGNGYSLVSNTSTESNLAAWGFLDPVDYYFGYRPPLPAWIAFDRPTNLVRTMPDADAPQVENRTVEANVPILSNGLYLTPNDPKGDVGIGWYQLPASGPGEEWVAGYVDDGYGSILRAGEAYRVGREWAPPTASEEQPLVIDYRFEPGNGRTCAGSGCTAPRADRADCICTLGGSLINHAEGYADGTVGGNVTLTVPYDDLLGNQDVDEICDEVGGFSSTGYVDLAPSGEDFNVHGGVAVELEVLLDGFLGEGEQVLASQWAEGEEQWKLAVTTATITDDSGSDVLVGTLRFTVRRSTGDDLELSYVLPLPDCYSSLDYDSACDSDGTTDFSCDGSCDASALNPQCVRNYGYRQWTHVAAVYDPSVGQTAELYWDGARRAQQAVTRQITPGEAPIRVGEGFRGRLDNVRLWARPAEPETTGADTVLILDSSGSMATNDPNDQRKNAARLFLNVVPDGDKVAAIDFDGVIRAANSDVLSVSDPDGRAAVLAVINSVDSSGSTNIGIAVDRACDILRRPSAQNPFKAAILLTDGQGSVTSQQKDCFVDNDWSLHALGFGGANQAQLNAIIAGTGPRSTADIVGSAEAVLCRMLQLRSELSGQQAAACFEYLIGLGETITFQQLVETATRITLSIAWPGSDVEMTLRTPSGRVIGRDVDAPDVIHEVGPTFESYTIDCPEAGLWTIELFGVDIPVGVEPVVYGSSEIGGDSCAPVEACGTDALAEAGSFNAFVFGDFIEHGSEAKGRIAAGGTVDISQYRLGSAITPIGGDSVVAGGHLHYDNGRIHGGDAVYGVSADLAESAILVDGVLRQGMPIDFSAAEARLRALAQTLAALETTGTTEVTPWGTIKLTGTEPERNVFRLAAADLANANSVILKVPVDATAILVVDGDTVTLENAGVSLRNGATTSRTVWVMPDALNLRIYGIGLPGSVLAPRADVDFTNGALNGTLVGKSLLGDGVFYSYPFAGCLPQP